MLNIFFLHNYIFPFQMFSYLAPRNTAGHGVSVLTFANSPRDIFHLAVMPCNVSCFPFCHITHLSLCHRWGSFLAVDVVGKIILWTVYLWSMLFADTSSTLVFPVTFVTPCWLSCSYFHGHFFCVNKFILCEIGNILIGIT